MNKKALVLGITGQDGAYLSRFLLQHGYQVIGTTRNIQQASLAGLTYLNIQHNVKLVECNLLDRSALLQFITDSKPTEIYHLAAQSSVGKSFDYPTETVEGIVIGTLNVLEILKKLPNTKLFHAASSDCFGDNAATPADETTPFNPKNPYAISKTAAFWLVKNYRDTYQLPVCSGILFNHESPIRPATFVTQKIIKGIFDIIDHKAENLSVGNLGIIRDWGLAAEYVEAMWLMLNTNTQADYVIATGHSDTLLQFIDYAFQYVNLDYKKYLMSDPALIRPTETLKSYANPEKIKRDLHWSAQSTLKQVVNTLMHAYEKRINQTTHR